MKKDIEEYVVKLRKKIVWYSIWLESHLYADKHIIAVTKERIRWLTEVATDLQNILDGSI